MARASWLFIGALCVVAAAVVGGVADHPSEASDENPVPSGSRSRAVGSRDDASGHGRREGEPARPRTVELGQDRFATTLEGLRVEASPEGVRVETRDETDPGAKPTTLSLATEMRRGDSAVGGNVRDVRGGADGSLTLDRGDVIERVAPSGEAIEQTWTFARAPSGDGPLEVSIGASPAFVHSDESGLHFRDEGASLGLRYGQATFVDANDARTPVAVYYEGGEIRARIPAEVIDGAAYPAVLDPLLGPEVPVQTGDVGMSSMPQNEGRIACSATNCMIVWRDFFGEVASVSSPGVDLYGIRVGFDGTIIDALPIIVDAGPGMQQEASIASNGTHYFVSWIDADPSNPSNPTEVKGRMIDAATGAFATTNPLVIEGSGAWVASPTVLANGATFEVVYGMNASVMAARIAADGASITAGPDELFATNGFNYLRAANAGNVAGIFFASGTAGDYAVGYRRVELDTHSPIETTDQALTSGVNSVEVAASPNWFGVLMSIPAPTGALLILGRVGVADGKPTVTAAQLSTTAMSDRPCTVTFSTDFVASWHEQDGRIDSVRVSELGAILDTVTTRLSASFFQWLGGSSADANGVPVIAYSIPGTAGNPAHIAFGAYTNATGLASPRGLVGRVSPIHDGIGAATNAAGKTLAAVAANTANGSRIRGAFGDFVAMPDMLAASFEVSVENTYTSGTVVATDGTDFLVVWAQKAGAYTEAYQVRGAKVAANGIPATAFTISTNDLTYSPPHVAVAYDPGSKKYLVVWDGSHADFSNGIFGRLVSSTPTVAPLGSELLIGDGPQGENEPVVAGMSGAGFLVAWEDSRDAFTPGGNGVEGYGTVVSDVGVVANTSGVVYATGAGNQAPVAIGVVGSAYVLLASDGGGGLNRIDVNSAGSVEGSPTPVLAGPGGQYIAKARLSTANGRLVVAALVASQTSRALYFADLTGGGAASLVADGVMFAPYALAPTGPNDYVLAFTRFVSAPTELGIRGRVMRVGLERPQGASCAGDVECKSGTCEDGVCCNVACGGSATDCRACSVAAGAAVDGTCGTIALAADHVCRPAASACDVAEVCDGLGVTCPSDQTTCGTGGGGGNDGGVGGGTGGGIGGGTGGGSGGSDGGVGSVEQPSATLCSVGHGAGSSGALPLSMLLVGVAIAWRRRRTRRASKLVPTLLLVLVMGAPAFAAAQASTGAQDPETVARLHFQLGQALYQEGRFADAAREFQAAYEASHRPQLLYNVYVAHRDAQQLEAALTALRSYIEQVPESETGNLRSRVATLEAQVAELVRLREEREREEAAEAAQGDQAAEAEDGARDEEGAQAEAASQEGGSSSGRRIAGFGLIGAGAVGIVGFTVAGLRIGTKDDGIAQYCGANAGLPVGRCLDVPEVADARSSISTLRVIGWTSLGVGVAAAATGTVLLLTGKEPSDTQVSFLCDPEGCYGAVTHRF